MKLLPNPTGDNFLEPYAISDRRLLAKRIENCEVLPYDIFNHRQYRKFIRMIKEERLQHDSKR